MFKVIGVIKKDRRTNNDLIRIHNSGDKALITYDDPFTAKSAIDWFNEKEFNGSVISVSLYEKPPNRMSDRGRRDDRGGRGGDRMFSRGGGFRGGPGGRLDQFVCSIAQFFLFLCISAYCNTST